MKNTKIINKAEPVKVMALFGYEMTPCQPLTFKRQGEREVEVTELVRAQIKFAGATTHHIFDVLSGRKSYRLDFNSRDLAWVLVSTD